MLEVPLDVVNEGPKVHLPGSFERINIIIYNEHSQDSKQISDHFLEPVIPPQTKHREI